MLDQIQFSSLGEFLQMGNYSFHVWIAYGIFAVFIAFNLLMPLRRRRQFIREQKRRIRRAEARNRTASGSASGYRDPVSEDSVSDNVTMGENP